MNTQRSTLTVLGALASLTQVVAQSDQPLNIVYIMSDDHTQQMISCYDRRHISTPNIDRIARDGVRFTQSFVANSISGPSRACMLTGKHSHLNGKRNNDYESNFDQNQQTMPKLLQKAGYQTALVGKLHLEGIPQGFDYWTMLPGQGEYHDPQFIRPKADGGTETVQYRGYVTNIITDLSLDWLEQRDRSKPFALFIHHKAAHRIWMADTTDLMKYEDRAFELPTTFYDDYKGRPDAARAEMSILRDMHPIYDLKMLEGAPEIKGLGLWYSSKNDTEGVHGRLRPEVKRRYDELYAPLSRDFYARKLEGKELAEWKYQRYMRDYAKVIESLDRNIGRVIDYLKAHDLLENTLIVYTSDQGFYMGEHGWFDKRFMYEESMRTPLVMRLPNGFSKRGDIDAMVQNIDYAPTFLDLAGAPIPSDMQGLSLVPLLRGTAKNLPRTSLYYHFYEFPGEHAVARHYGVRTERYKLIRFYDHKNPNKGRWELYDLKRDPQELTNLYNNPRIRRVQAELHVELDRQRRHYKAQDAY